MAKKFHVAIIMDGNGRWAKQRNQPRTVGHQEGAIAVRKVVEKAPTLNIQVLTLYAFSSDNFSRPQEEVDAIFLLLENFITKEEITCLKNGIRLKFIGRRDRIPQNVVQKMGKIELSTAAGENMELRIAVDYSSRDYIVKAAAEMARRRLKPSRDSFAECMGHVLNLDSPAEDVDLLIRTSGEQRLSDFLLWESAYAEFIFISKLWPDFEKSDLEDAITQFKKRNRRFGSLKSAPLNAKL